MAKTPKTASTKVRLEVVDINTVANSILLEGSVGNLKYILMIDADLDQSMVTGAVVGDKWDVTLKNTIKLKKVTSSNGQTLVKGSPCPGSGRVLTDKDIYLGKAVGYSYKIKKTKCADCGKEISVNGGYNGKPLTIRKHNV